jgi:hypothetical protein
VIFGLRVAVFVHERKTKRPGGRYKTRKPGETTRLTPLTRIIYWLMPVPN